jgi:hypothetical protein
MKTRGSGRFSRRDWLPPAGSTPEPEEQGKTGDEEKDPEGVPFLRASFWFGIFIVLMASTMKHLHH